MGVVIWASLTTTANALHLTLANIFSRPEIKYSHQNSCAADERKIAARSIDALMTYVVGVGIFRAKVLEEQKQVLGKSKGVGYEQVKQMNYLEAAIRESLRVSGAIRNKLSYASIHDPPT